MNELIKIKHKENEIKIEANKARNNFIPKISKLLKNSKNHFYKENNRKMSIEKPFQKPEEAII